MSANFTEFSIGCGAGQGAAARSDDIFEQVLAGFWDFVAERVDAVAEEHESAQDATIRIARAGRALARGAGCRESRCRAVQIVVHMGLNRVDPYFGCERYRNGALDS